MFVPIVSNMDMATLYIYDKDANTQCVSLRLENKIKSEKKRIYMFSFIVS